MVVAHDLRVLQDVPRQDGDAARVPTDQSLADEPPGARDGRGARRLAADAGRVDDRLRLEDVVVGHGRDHAVRVADRGRRAKPSRKLSANGAAPSAWTAARRGNRSINPHAHASRSALPNAAVLPRLPAGRTIHSGGSQPSCCSSSSTTVFWPSRRNGLTELRRYTPSRSPA